MKAGALPGAWEIPGLPPVNRLVARDGIDFSGGAARWSDESLQGGPEKG